MPPQQSITYFYTEALLQAKKLTYTAQQLGAEAGSIDELRGNQPAFLSSKRRNEPLQSTLPETQGINILQVNETDPLTSASD